MRDLEYSSFHQVRRGQCLIECAGEREMAGPGDIIFIPNGSDHILKSIDGYAPGRENEFKTMLLCGYFQFDQEIEHPLMASLPQLVIIRSEALENNTGLKNTLDLLTEEFTNNQPGSRLLMDRLTEIMLIQLIRTEFTPASQGNFSKALFDNQISQALKLIHGDVARSWTLDSLATEVGMSRTSLATRFKEFVGTTMFDYLTKIRLQKACNLLKTTGQPVYSIAEKSGYRSEISFNKAFKQNLSLTPGQYRKKSRQNQND
jgi:AraC-like DNA-binding protein